MRQFLAAIAACLALAGGPAPAQDIPGIRDTISAQVEAFRADDLVTAFGFASPAIRQLFQTPENFGAMVAGGYPMIWRPSGMIFHDQTLAEDRILQRMAFIDAEGAEHWFAYEMIEVGGQWRIDGVYPIEAPEVGV